MAQMTTKLTDRQHRALAALLTCPSVSEAAKVAKIGLRTMTRYCADPIFQTEYRRMRAEQVRQAVARLQGASSAAVTTLTTIVQDLTARPAVRIAAARSILEFAMHGAEWEDLENRLALVEQRLEAAS